MAARAFVVPARGLAAAAAAAGDGQDKVVIAEDFKVWRMDRSILIRGVWGWDFE